MFEQRRGVDRCGSTAPSPFERALTALLERPEVAVVDVVFPVGGLAWEWVGSGLGDPQESAVPEGAGDLGDAGDVDGVADAGDVDVDDVAGAEAEAGVGAGAGAGSGSGAGAGAGAGSGAGVAHADEVGGPGVAELRRLLDAGLDPLARAVVASRAIARLSAEVAMSLAEFARCRPAAELDRQPGERGAMSAATRAARPAALAEVSEWAVDEVAPTLRISSVAAGAQLADSVVLVERLPGTLAFLADGVLSLDPPSSRGVTARRKARMPL
jgi:hypothetical protein